MFDERSGKVIQRLDPETSSAITFNRPRNEIYISQYESKKVRQLDGTRYEVKSSGSFERQPASLLV